MAGTPKHLIINNPYTVPKRHWKYDRESRQFDEASGRRPAGYVMATPGARAGTFDDPGVFVEIPLVNMIRPRVDAWRASGYPGVTSTTRTLLEHWNDSEARQPDRRFFFCQLEAIETLIWLIEAPAAEKAGIDIPSDGGDFQRLCTKLATGGGKTIIMAMIIAWHVLNKVAAPNDGRFSKNILIVAPGLTVRERLSVLIPDSGGNYFDEFRIVPDDLVPRLRQGRVRIVNWQKLQWDTEEKLAKKKSVDKRGVKSDEAYCREVLEELARSRNLIVINDEAHHAWRAPSGDVRGVDKAEKDQATAWISGLDRIHRARGILTSFDLSATPYIPSGRGNEEERLYGWIVSDFGLNDAIEAGLVKTPRIVIRDDGVPDAQTYRSKLYHIYNDQEVKDDLNRKALPEEPLPDLVNNAYFLLGKDWLETKRRWEAQGHDIPPVMITVCNRTETAARIKYAFDTGGILIPELNAPEKTLHIDSKVLAKAEEQDEAVTLAADTGDDEEGEDSEPKLTKAQQAELIRQMVGTVGKPGELGEQIQNVISVAMLSEGWDAKTVTHIMGLRAFTSQLLCEQVIGRGLRRTTYDIEKSGFGEEGAGDGSELSFSFRPEYVNVFGVPFTFMPHESDSEPPPPPPPKTMIEPDPDKAEYELTWPNIVRIEHTLTPKLSLTVDDMEPLTINAMEIRQIADLAPVVAGKPDPTRISPIDLRKLGEEYRYQRLVFEAAKSVFAVQRPAWRGDDDFLLAQLIRHIERFIRSNRLRIEPELFMQDELRRRVVLAMSMSTIVTHLRQYIEDSQVESRRLVFDEIRPIRSTGDMRTWFTSRPCERTKRSHINFCVYDSTWEASESYFLDRPEAVEYVSAWAKNEHLGFEIKYLHRGVVRKYRPDYLIKLVDGTMLVLEVKGENTPKAQAKRKALERWCEAVTEQGEFGRWVSDVAFSPGEIVEILPRTVANSRRSAQRIRS